MEAISGVSCTSYESGNSAYSPEIASRSRKCYYKGGSTCEGHQPQNHRLCLCSGAPPSRLRHFFFALGASAGGVGVAASMANIADFDPIERLGLVGAPMFVLAMVCCAFWFISFGSDDYENAFAVFMLAYGICGMLAIPIAFWKFNVLSQSEPTKRAAKGMALVFAGTIVFGSVQVDERPGSRLMSEDGEHILTTVVIMVAVGTGIYCLSAHYKTKNDNAEDLLRQERAERDRFHAQAQTNAQCLQQERAEAYRFYAQAQTFAWRLQQTQAERDQAQAAHRISTAHHLRERSQADERARRLAIENATIQKHVKRFKDDLDVPQGTRFHIPELGGFCKYERKDPGKHVFTKENGQSVSTTVKQLGDAWTILRAADTPWWECEVSRDVWIPYPEEVNQKLEKAHGSGRPDEVHFTRQAQRYKIVFDGRTEPQVQMNMGTNAQRSIRRGFSSLAGASVLADGVPDYWIGDEEFQCVSAPERVADLQAKMVASIKPGTTHGMTNLRVHRVERIENKALWWEYQHHRGIMSDRRHGTAGHECLFDRPAVQAGLQDLQRVIGDKDNNELWLWHGTKPETGPTIAQLGFDERLASMRGLYGAGNYFADNSSKSHQYRGTPKKFLANGTPDPTWVPYSDSTNAAGHHCMLLCRVAMGTPYLTDVTHQHERRPPPNPATQGLPYDSIFAETQVANYGTQLHNEYIVFKSSQVYPEFIIWYTV